MSLLAPTDLPGLAVWMDAPSLGFVANGSVTSWPPIVGPGVSVGFLGSPDPQCKLNQLNGLPIVRFRNGQGRLRATMPDSGTDYTALGVGRMGTGVNGRLFSGLYPPNNWLMGWWNSFEDVGYSGGFMPAAGGSVPASGAWRVYSMTHLGSVGRLWRHGALLAMVTNLTDRLGPAFAFSGYDPSGTSETADCEMAEWLVFAPGLSDADRQKAEGYLHWRWGLQAQLPVGHPYHDAAPILVVPSSPLGVQARVTAAAAGIPRGEASSLGRLAVASAGTATIGVAEQ